MYVRGDYSWSVSENKYKKTTGLPEGMAAFREVRGYSGQTGQKHVQLLSCMVLPGKPDMRIYCAAAAWAWAITAAAIAGSTGSPVAVSIILPVAGSSTQVEGSTPVRSISGATTSWP